MYHSCPNLVLVAAAFGASVRPLRYQHKTTRNAMKKLREMTDKKEAEKLFPEVVAMLDQLAKRNIIHDNKAANLKSKLAKHVASL